MRNASSPGSINYLVALASAQRLQQKNNPNYQAALKVFELEEYQQPPPEPWDVWMFLGGRGSGKTITGSTDTIKHLREQGRRARIGVMAPTAAAVRDVCMEGETGLITLYRDEFTQWLPSRGFARHKNGGVVYAMGSEEPARWNGPQWSRLWVDELALCNPDSWTQAHLALRLGPHPQAIITTTPKGAEWVQDLSLGQRRRPDGTIVSLGMDVAVTRATTFDNLHLSARVRDNFLAVYENTTLGRQELYAEWLGYVEGAIFPTLQGHAHEFLQAAPRAVPYFDEMGRQHAGVNPFTRTGAGIDWGTTEAHQSAIVSGSTTKAGTVWARRRWQSAQGSSNELRDELGRHRDDLGVTFARVDRSQGSLVDPIEALGIGADFGTRDVEWRIAVMRGLIEKHQVFFDVDDPSTRELFDSLCQYHRDDKGRIHELGDDDVDAFLYLVAELVHPGPIDITQLGGMRQTTHRSQAKSTIRRTPATVRARRE